MTDNERAVIEAAVEWLNTRRTFGAGSGESVRHEALLARSIDLLHNERDAAREKPHD